MARVTVLMPTYNVAPYVAEAIGSVLAQTFADFTLLVVDDGSTDGTPDIVAAIGDPRIRLAAFADNVGLADNLNRGLDLVQTELVARMDGDDVALPHWLQAEVDYLDAHPDVDICGGGFERFGTDSTVVRFPEWHDDIVVNMLFECTMAVPTLRMAPVRRHHLRYRADAFPAEDYRFWADAAPLARMHNLPLTLFRYRMHPTQICSSRRDEQRAKVVAVRRHMLRWLNPAMAEADIEYFINQFAAPEVDNPADLRRRRAFARRLVTLGARGGNIDPDALRRGLRRRLRLALHATVVRRHFADGYSARRYLRYLGSGLALRCGAHYELRFLAKSLLRRRQ